MHTKLWMAMSMHFWKRGWGSRVGELKCIHNESYLWCFWISTKPSVFQTDKISLLGSTIKYVKQLEEKVKTLKGQSARRTSEPTTIFNSKCRISTDSSDASGSRTGGFGPTVEARICGDTVLLNICCEDRRGMLVKLISELDNQGLSIINTSVLPFTDSCLNITITAKAPPINMIIMRIICLA